MTRAWLGVMIQSITPDMQEALGLEKRVGALVADVVEDSPAAKAGIVRGDVIISFDGQKVDSQHQLPTMVAYLPVGTKVEVVVLRDGKEKTFNVTLEEMTEETAMAGPSGQPEKMEGDLGLTVQNLTPEMAREKGVDPAEGVVITGIEPASPAAESGLRTGDIILEVDRKPVNDAESLSRILKETSGKGSLLFLVNRDGRTIFLAVKR